jgi:CRP/FNR family transcriptional regulator, cyclic AMP receptor protein
MTRDADRPAGGWAMKGGSSLLGLRKILLPRLGRGRSSSELAAAAGASLGSVALTTDKHREQDLVEFLGRVGLFEDFGSADLARLARSAHERKFHDGERIYEQGTPGAALFIVRSGIVEIRHRPSRGEEVAVASLEPPASFSEDGAMGAEALRWSSAVARGPVALVALGSSDLNALSHRYPQLAIKVLRRLGQMTALRLHLLLEAQIYADEDQAGADEPKT